MKIAIYTAVALLLSAGYAFAGGGAPVPPQLPGAPSSGRPSAVLNDSECEDTWNKAVGGPAGGAADTLSPDKGAKIMTDFQQADTDKDGNLSKAEFQAACKLGLVQRSPASP